MPEQDSQDAGGSHAAREKVERAMIEVSDVRQQYLTAVQHGLSGNQRLLREFHTSVMAYYIELANYRDEGAVEEDWETIELWQERGEPVTGADTLEQWIGRTERRQTASAGLGGDPEVAEVPVTLDGQKLLSASRALDQLAKQLGIKMEVTESKPRTEISEELFEEVDEWRRKKLQDA